MMPELLLAGRELARVREMKFGKGSAMPKSAEMLEMLEKLVDANLDFQVPECGGNQSN
jgi:hypothetical protein